MQTGTDQKGSFYSSIEAMWQSEMNSKNQKTTNPSISDPSSSPHQIPTHQFNDPLGKRKSAVVVNPIGSVGRWYSKANQYWQAAEATYDGVLSGYGRLSQIDIKGSFNFLSSYLQTKSKSFVPNRVIDCGAGIGRIAKELLCSMFSVVDVVDQCEKYIEKSREVLKGKNVGHFYAKGLQEFNFEEKYDCVWVQWVLSHLTDADAVEFLSKAKKSLNKEGFIVVKENCCEDGFLVDKDDCSVSRSDLLYKVLFEKAGLAIKKEQFQQNWPDDLLNVKMYLLQ